MAGTAKIKRELERMLSALEGQLLGAEIFASSVESSLKAETFSAYQSFRTKVDELRCLSVVIEDRFTYLFDEDVGFMRQQFELLDVLLLTMIIRCYRQFFIILSNSQVLPLGAREIFAPELNVLDATRERLTRPIYADQIAEGLMVELELAAEAIRVVVERAEPLPDFSDLAHNPGMEDDRRPRLLN